MSDPVRRVLARAFDMAVTMRTAGREPLGWRCSDDVRATLAAFGERFGHHGLNVGPDRLLTFPIAVDPNLPANSLILDERLPYELGSLRVSINGKPA